jgi:6,7-dimethyl-8-ribityllumazine synthase
MKVLIVEARFYDDIADELAKGAIGALEAVGAEVDRIDVPGALEIPAAIRFAADGNDGYDGFVALGCVIRGETSHYDYVCGESVRGLQDLAIRDRLAIGNGILTVENRDQAWERCSVDKYNKGGAVAEAAVRMIELKKQYGIA